MLIANATRIGNYNLKWNGISVGITRMRGKKTSSLLKGSAKIIALRHCRKVLAGYMPKTTMSLPLFTYLQIYLIDLTELNISRLCVLCMLSIAKTNMEQLIGYQFRCHPSVFVWLLIMHGEFGFSTPQDPCIIFFVTTSYKSLSTSESGVSAHIT
ncbi:unnamed protein product [Onchocerca ochengi]|uniref:Ovule protein n=1 Tax=Onchocerca ochengi TaxID=42157 RepID=A0A182E532_ONCOC|nr:unnamed protein product [Onchocerca ochengi]